MKKISLLITILIFFAFTVSLFSQVTYDLRFVTVNNDQTVNGNFDTKVQVKANNGTFLMGTANLVFTYNTSALKFDSTGTAHNFNNPPFYQLMTFTEPAIGRVSLNIEQAFATFGTTVPDTGFFDVGTVNFTIKNTSQTTNFLWRTATPNETQIFDGNDTSIPPALIPYGNLNGSDVPLPVQLASLNSTIENSRVVLNWATESEINNLGFEVWRSDEADGQYNILSSYDENPALEGHGNSNTRHEYSYTDDLVVNGQTYHYKVYDVDYNGVRTEHGPVSATVSVGGLTSISPDIPDDYQLYQNFPNPFNPSTTLQFDIPFLQNGPVDGQLIVYNSLGQKLKVLYAGQMSPGSFRVQWDGTTQQNTSAPSGIYFARLIAGNYVQTIKMMLIR